MSGAIIVNIFYSFNERGRLECFFAVIKLLTLVLIDFTATLNSFPINTDGNYNCYLLARKNS